MNPTPTQETELRHARATAIIAGRAIATSIRHAAQSENNEKIRHHLIYAVERALQASEELAALIEGAMDEKHNEQHPEDSGDEPEASAAEPETESTAR